MLIYSAEKKARGKNFWPVVLQSFCSARVREKSPAENAVPEPCDPDGRVGCFHLGDKNTARQSDHSIALVWGIGGFPMTATYYRQARITLVTFGG